jgi:hypothetical protein
MVTQRGLMNDVGASGSLDGMINGLYRSSGDHLTRSKVLLAFVEDESKGVLVIPDRIAVRKDRKLMGRCRSQEGKFKTSAKRTRC